VFGSRLINRHSTPDYSKGNNNIRIMKLPFGENVNQAVPNIVFEHVDSINYADNNKINKKFQSEECVTSTCGKIDSNCILRRSTDNLVFEPKIPNNAKGFDHLAKSNNKSPNSLVVLNNQLQIEPTANISSYRKFGGSVQNLLNVGRNSMRLNIKKKFCKSENNLVEVETKKSKIQVLLQSFSKSKVTPLSGSDSDLLSTSKSSDTKNWKTYFQKNTAKKNKVQANKRYVEIFVHSSAKMPHKPFTFYWNFTILMILK
jgi:hypothetical protein